MQITINNLTASTRTYLAGTISVPGNSSIPVLDNAQKILLSTDGQLRSDLLSSLVQLSDGTNVFGANDALDYLKRSAINLQYVRVEDSNQIDGFGRIRISDFELIESLHFANTNHPLLVNTATTGSATVTSQLSNSSLRLSTTTSSSDTAIAQTKRYFRYNPGNGYVVTISGNIGSAKTNVTQRWGYFDANNGIYFSQTSSGLAINVRTNSTGSPVDTTVAQSSWNLDKFDGTGLSGINLDPSKHNLYVIDFLWNGAGRIRFGILYNGRVVYCHQIDNANINALPYMRVPSLPLRVELNNTGTTASTTTLDLVCFAYQKESSGALAAPYSFTASTVAASKTVGNTILPLLSIRPSATFNSMTNRVPIVPKSIQVAANQNLIYCVVYLNPTLTGASFTSVGTNSSVEFDTAATAVSGGTKVAEFYVAASSTLTSTISGDLVAALDSITLGLDIAGSAQDTLCVAARSTAGGTSAWAQMQWQEFQ